MKNRTLNKKYYLKLLLTLSITILNCGDKTAKLEDYFKICGSIRIDKKHMLTNVIDVGKYNDSLYVLTDFFARKIFFINTESGAAMVLAGRTGVRS